MTPILFVDVDGVLNSDRFHRGLIDAGELILVSEGLQPTDSAQPLPHCPDYPFEFELFDPAAVARLNLIVDSAGADIVIHSSWRHQFTDEALISIFRSRGITGNILGCTPAAVKPRGESIWMWLEAFAPAVRGANLYVALDDYPAECLRPVEHRLLQTDLATGLRDHHVPLAIAMLQGASLQDALRDPG